jgi:hypothetical protein
MMLQGEENDGINIVLLGGAAFIVFVICAFVFGIFRRYRRVAAQKQATGEEK